MAACPNCGEANPDHARFCLACGAALAAAPAPAREMRKTVTVLFCDLKESTPIVERLDPETYRRIISRYFVEVSSVLERHGGTVEKFIGDAVMAVFGIPTVREDDALRAVRAATELREALARLNDELRAAYGVELTVRTGITTGEVVAGDPTEGQAFATGDAVVVAQRLEAAAGAGEILIGEPTHRLVRNAVLVEPVPQLDLKGKAEPVPAWRLLGVVSGAPAFARRLDSPLVGRQRELALLEQAFRRAVDERACHLFTVLGAAGVGKSRLVNELITALGEEARVLIGRCVPYGEGITFWPLTGLVRQAANVGPRLSPEETRRRLEQLLGDEPEKNVVADRLAAATGLGDAEATNEEIFWAVRKLFETLGRDKPLVVAFDDVQWAEPTFLDLVDYLADWTRNARVLLVCLARPELLDDRPAWGGGKLNATSILLEPLRAAEVELLIGNLLGEGDVAEEIRRSLLEAGEGNPLFVEEMLAMLIDQGRLREGDGGWTADEELGAIETPPTIQALLAARIDRLGSEERDVLERASVVGKLFSREAIAALVPDESSVDEHLGALVRKDLIRPDRTADDAFRFRHILIRDAAYLGLSKEARAGLHEEFGSWLERERPGRRREYEEILGYHLEQAHRHRSELAAADEHTGALATKAAELLASAGRRAALRGDMPAAVGLLTRATLLLRDDDASRLALAPDLGGALVECGELARADAVLSRAVEGAAARGLRAVELRARLALALLKIRSDPSTGAEEVRTVAEEAIAEFEELGDEAGLADAWNVLSSVYWLTAQWAKRADALERALVHARNAGDRRREAQVLGLLPVALLWGSTPIPEAAERCREILEQAGDDAFTEARTTVVLGELVASLGRPDEARELYRRGMAVLEDRGLLLWSGIFAQTGGTIEMLADNPEGAEAELRRGYETLRRIGEKASLSTLAALLSEAVYAQGQYEEAERLAGISENAAQAEDIHSHVILRGTRAKVLARRGEFERAAEVAGEALGLAAQTDALAMQADAELVFAEVLRLAGRESEATAAAERAIELYDAKGHAARRARAEAWLALPAAP
jgi:predicted ATPase/class 3 adenylate cyclase